MHELDLWSLLIGPIACVIIPLVALNAILWFNYLKDKDFK